MTSKERTIRIGYVPEHYLTPLHLAIRSSAASSLPFSISLVPFPSGTGHMITSLRSNEIDIGIGLTEGWVAGLTGKQQIQELGEKKDGGYKIVGQWVETPLRWAIVTGRDRRDLESVTDLKGKRVGISRLGSGSHIMSFVLSKQQGWPEDSLKPVILGPFRSLRDGVTGYHAEEEPSKAGGATSGQNPSAEFFMWEHFTTKPYFHPVDTTVKPYPPLKKIGEIYTPWPSWLIVASTSTFPDPTSDTNLAELLDLFDRGIQEFEANPDGVVDLLETGELGCTYAEEDAREWMKDVKFAKPTTRGLDPRIVDNVVDVLKGAGVIAPEMSAAEAIKRVTGIPRQSLHAPPAV